MWPFTRKPKVLVRVHKAYFNNIMELEHEPYYFINVLNIEKSKNIIITNIKCDFLGRFTLYQQERPYPVKITPGEQWETWIKVEKAGEKAYENFYVFLDTRRPNSLDRKSYIIRSTLRINVPNSGIVPGDR